MEVEDEELLVGGEVAALQVRPQVVEPPQAAALPRPLQPCTCIVVPLERDIAYTQNSCKNKKTTQKTDKKKEGK